MADIRINALATTAASTASDDFIAVDGSANGTRKLNAYSPTFGGNLTVSGTTSSITLGSTNTGSIAVDSNGGLTITPKAGQALTLAGASSIKAGVGYAGLAEISNGLYFGGASYAFAQGDSGDTYVNAKSGQSVYLRVNNTTVAQGSAGAFSVAGNLTVSGAAVTMDSTSAGVGFRGTSGGHNRFSLIRDDTLYPGSVLLSAFGEVDLMYGATTTATSGTVGARLTASGNFMIGSTGADGGQKLQVSGAAAITGAVSTGSLTVNPGTTSTALVLKSSQAGSYGWQFIQDEASTGNFFIQRLVASTASNVLTLDRSNGDATFAGTVTLPNDKAIYFKEVGGTAQRFALNSGDVIYIEPDQLHKISIGGAGVTNVGVGGIGVAGNSVFGGTIAIGNTVQTAASVASTHKVTISIGGTTYYLLATNV